MKSPRLFLAIALLASWLIAGIAHAAAPSLHEVYLTAESGDLKKAQTMMDQVLRDHPNSAKAHMVEADLLAKEGRLDLAKAEFATAERLAPGLPFARPEAVADLRQRLQAAQQPSFPALAMPPSGADHSGLPWASLLAGGLALGALMMFLRSQGRAREIPVPGSYSGAAGNAWGHTYPQTVGTPAVGPMAATSSGGIGSGLLGGLATGAAVGAGIVAGEALLHKVMDGGHRQPAESLDDPFQALSPPAASDPGFDLGGSDFGISDPGSWDDSGGDSGDGW